MDKMPRSKDRSRGELEKLREMTFKQKTEYIWSYYNYYIIGIIVAVAVIMSLITTCLNRPDIGLSVEWSSPHIEQAELEAVMSALEKRLFDESDGRTVDSIYTPVPKDDPVIVMQHTERLLALLTAGVIDIFIVDYPTLCGYSELEFLVPFDVLFDSEQGQKYKDTYNMLTDIGVYTTYGRIQENLAVSNDDDGLASDTGRLRMTGIKVTDSRLLSNMSVKPYDDVYLCVAISVKNIDNAIRAIIEFME